jgi:hypothetical protein
LPAQFAQPPILLDHGPDHLAGNAQVVQIHNLIGPQVERAGAVGHKRQHH